MINFVDNAINYRLIIVDPKDKYYTNRYFHKSGNFFVNQDFITFTLIIVNEGKEHLLIAFLKDRINDMESIKITVTLENEVLNIKETNSLLAEQTKLDNIRYLNDIANWNDNPNSLFGDLAIHSFATTHFGNKCVDIKKKYRELAHQHHPDKGGDELMFKAIKRAMEYLTVKQD